MNLPNQQTICDGIANTEIIVKCPMIILLDGELDTLVRQVKAFGGHYQEVFASRDSSRKRPIRKSQEQIKAEIKAIGGQGGTMMRRIKYLGEAYPGEFFGG
jgi:hypothetical protein